MPLCIYKTRFEKTGHKNAETPDFSGVSGECIYFGHSRWRSGRDSNPRAAFDDNTISSRARYDLFDTTAYSLSADRQRRLLYQNLDRCQDIFFAGYPKFCVGFLFSSPISTERFLPTFLWDFGFKPRFRMSDFFQLLCGISSK